MPIQAKMRGTGEVKSPVSSGGAKSWGTRNEALASEPGSLQLGTGGTSPNSCLSHTFTSGRKHHKQQKREKLQLQTESSQMSLIKEEIMAGSSQQEHRTRV